MASPTAQKLFFISFCLPLGESLTAVPSPPQCSSILRFFVFISSNGRRQPGSKAVSSDLLRSCALVFVRMVVFEEWPFLSDNVQPNCGRVAIWRLNMTAKMVDLLCIGFMRGTLFLIPITTVV